jgi:hypothetical protein
LVITRTATQQHSRDRLQENPQVETQPHLRGENVIQGDASTIGGVVAAAHLPEAGQAWPHRAIAGEPAPVADSLGLDDGARPDDAHLAPKDIHELGQLVDAGLAHEAAQAGDPRIVAQLVIARPLLAGRRIAGQHVAQTLVGVDHHAAELEAGEPHAAATDPALRVDRRAAVLDPDQEGDHQHHRRQEDQGGARDQDVENPDDQTVTAAL